MLTHLAAYRFTPLEKLTELRQELLSECTRLELKGTILLAPEGINLSLAGPSSAVEAFLTLLQAHPEIGPLPARLSACEQQPFPRLLLRLKQEIIAFGRPDIRPASQSAPRLAPEQLAQWLDQGRPLVLLDTRNDYEIKLGSFHSALDLGLKRFRDFPQASQALAAELKHQEVVTFCTGGIRCEKAALYLQQQGFKRVWQLEGGILEYFRRVGSAHYQGECFVFDRRVGLDEGLQPTPSLCCPACLTPLTPAEQAHPLYRAGLACPHCATDPAQIFQEKLNQLAQELPGRLPAENRRPIRMPGWVAGMTLAQALAQIFPQREPQEWQELCDGEGLIELEGPLARLDQVVRAGQQFARIELAQIEPDVNASLSILYLDEALLVLNKPAPLPMHPCGRFCRNTLVHLLKLACQPEVPRPAYRLDANTTGVVVCGRNHHVAKLLQPMVAQGKIEKSYLARIQGHPPQGEFSVSQPLARQPGPLGLRLIDSQGDPCLSRFRLLERSSDGTSLVEAQPVTGRTNQLRAHLWWLGFPVLGDPSFLPQGQLGNRQTLSPEDPPMHLHCSRISLIHPVTKKKKTFEAPPPWL